MAWWDSTQYVSAALERRLQFCSPGRFFMPMMSSSLTPNQEEYTTLWVLQTRPTCSWNISFASFVSFSEKCILQWVSPCFSLLWLLLELYQVYLWLMCKMECKHDACLVCSSIWILLRKQYWLRRKPNATDSLLILKRYTNDIILLCYSYTQDLMQSVSHDNASISGNSSCQSINVVPNNINRSCLFHQNAAWGG